MRIRSRFITAAAIAVTLISLSMTTPAFAGTDAKVVSATVDQTVVDVTATSGSIVVNVVLSDPDGSADPMVELVDGSTGTEDDDDAVEMYYLDSDGSTDRYVAEIDVPDSLSLGTWDVEVWPYADDWEESEGLHTVVGHVNVVKHWTANAASVSLQGDPTVFRLFTAQVSGLDEPADSISYAWYSGFWNLIATNTTGHYLLSVKDLGHRIYVVATVNKRGYPPLLLGGPEASAPLIAGYVMPVVALSGQPVAGQKVGVVVDRSVPGPLSYQWNLDRIPIAGATAATYTPVAREGGHGLSVTLGWSGPEGLNIITSTPPAKRILLAFAKPKVTLSGTAKVGHRLRAHVSGWGTNGVSVRYQWMANGRVIRGQHSASYVPTVHYRRKVITVDVKATKAHYRSAWSPVSQGKRVHS